jgi:hypothetical protein
VRVQEVLILCTGEVQISERDLTSWLERLSVEDYRYLLISARGSSGFTSKQRSRVGEFWKQAGRTPPRVALLSDSAVARGVLTAIGWLLENPTRAFSPLDLRGALAFLGTSASALEVASQLEALHVALDKKARRSA